MINVEVFSESNLWNKKIKKKNIFFNKIVNFFPKKYRFIKKRASLTILLSNDKKIKKLNKKFRGKNKSTDILSFPFEKRINLKKSSYLGDIVISYESMDKLNKLDDLEFKNNVIKIFIHGFLHLLGYDHIKNKDFKKMLKEEEKIYKVIKTKIVKLV